MRRRTRPPQSGDLRACARCPPPVWESVPALVDADAADVITGRARPGRADDALHAADSCPTSSCSSIATTSAEMLPRSRSSTSRAPATGSTTSSRSSSTADRSDRLSLGRRLHVRAGRAGRRRRSTVPGAHAGLRRRSSPRSAASRDVHGDGPLSGNARASDDRHASSIVLPPARCRASSDRDGEPVSIVVQQHGARRRTACGRGRNGALGASHPHAAARPTGRCS